jgi:PAS domain S-box-containing protein
VVDRRITGEPAARELLDAFHLADAGLAISDGDATALLHVNAALCELLGRDEDEIIGHDLIEFTHPDDLPLTHAARVATGRTRYEKRYVRPDGSIVWALVGGEVVRDPSGAPRHFVGSVVDITAQKEAERELARRAERQEAIVDLGRQAFGEGVQDIDAVLDGAVHAARTHLGVDRASVLELLPGGAELLLRSGLGWHGDVVGNMRLPTNASQAGYAIRTEQSVVTDDIQAERRFTVPALRIQGVVSMASVIIRVDGRPWGVLGAHSSAWRRFQADDVAFLQGLADVVGAAIARAVHDEIAARAQTQDRLAFVGQLAAGLAHDFNNVLTVIKLHAELLCADPTLGDAAGDQVETIKAQADRAVGLVWQLLDVASRGDLRATDVDLGEFLRELAPVLRRAVPGGIELDVADGTRVHADAARLNQIVLNLAVNAADATGDGSPITISTRRRTDGGTPGVVLSVIDRGTGMAPDVAERAFDPFFSTKGPGKGTGLGLAQVRGLVLQHGGDVDLETAPGAGTTVKVWLPTRDGAAAEISVDEADIPLGQGELVLIVEDDEAVATALAATVAVLGYAVVTARDGHEAIVALDSVGGIQLVLTDLRMPNTDGAELAAHAAVTHPEVPVVITSADRRRPELLADSGGPAAAWLQKPYSHRELGEVLTLALRR